MNTTTIHSRAGRWATVAVVAGIAAGVPSAAIAGPQPVADIHTVRTDRPSSTVDDEYRKTVNHRTSGPETTTEGRPCFIIQSHWNPAYDGFVPVCGRPREETTAEQDTAERTGCPPPVDPRYVGVPWVSSVRTGCDNRDRWWIDIAGR